MESYLYLSLIPEALILSQLPPEQFGRHLATGPKRQIEGPAIFFAVDPDADLSAFKMKEARQRCTTHPDGSPRRSVYVSIYNVLAQVPLTALTRVYLTTPAGVTLGIEPGVWQSPVTEEEHFLYQELGPVYPRVASRLEPRSFCAYVTAPDQLISLPRLAFIDLKLGGLADEPEREGTASVPYQHMGHLRHCLQDLARDANKMTKIVNRGLRPDILFYLIRSGVFVGDARELVYFPLPGDEQLEREHLLWWHSAQAVRGY